MNGTYDWRESIKHSLHSPSLKITDPIDQSTHSYRFDLNLNKLFIRKVQYKHNKYFTKNRPRKNIDFINRSDRALLNKIIYTFSPHFRLTKVPIFSKHPVSKLETFFKFSQGKKNPKEFSLIQVPSSLNELPSRLLLKKHFLLQTLRTGKGSKNRHNILRGFKPRSILRIDKTNSPRKNSQIVERLLRDSLPHDQVNIISKNSASSDTHSQNIKSGPRKSNSRNFYHNFFRFRQNLPNEFVYDSYKSLKYLKRIKGESKNSESQSKSTFSMVIKNRPKDLLKKRPHHRIFARLNLSFQRILMSPLHNQLPEFTLENFNESMMEHKICSQSYTSSDTASTKSSLSSLSQSLANNDPTCSQASTTDGYNKSEDDSHKFEDDAQKSDDDVNSSTGAISNSESTDKSTFSYISGGGSVNTPSPVFLQSFSTNFENPSNDSSLKTPFCKPFCSSVFFSDSCDLDRDFVLKYFDFTRTETFNCIGEIKKIEEECKMIALSRMNDKTLSDQATNFINKLEIYAMKLVALTATHLKLFDALKGYTCLEPFYIKFGPLKLEQISKDIPSILPFIHHIESIQIAKTKSSKSTESCNENHNVINTSLCSCSPINHSKCNSQEKFCLCSQPAFGLMINCENPECNFGEHFHFACVGITEEPIGEKWKCPGCTCFEIFLCAWTTFLSTQFSIFNCQNSTGTLSADMPHNISDPSKCISSLKSILSKRQGFNITKPSPKSLHANIVEAKTSVNTKGNYIKPTNEKFFLNFPSSHYEKPSHLNEATASHTIGNMYSSFNGNYRDYDFFQNPNYYHSIDDFIRSEQDFYMKPLSTSHLNKSLLEDNLNHAPKVRGASEYSNILSHSSNLSLFPTPYFDNTQLYNNYYNDKPFSHSKHSSQQFPSIAGSLEILDATNINPTMDKPRRTTDINNFNGSTHLHTNHFKLNPTPLATNFDNHIPHVKKLTFPDSPFPLSDSKSTLVDVIKDKTNFTSKTLPHYPPALKKSSIAPSLPLPPRLPVLTEIETVTLSNALFLTNSIDYYHIYNEVSEVKIQYNLPFLHLHHFTSLEESHLNIHSLKQANISDLYEITIPRSSLPRHLLSMENLKLPSLSRHPSQAPNHMSTPQSHFSKELNDNSLEAFHQNIITLSDNQSTYKQTHHSDLSQIKKSRFISLQEEILDLPFFQENEKFHCNTNSDSNDLILDTLTVLLNQCYRINTYSSEPSNENDAPSISNTSNENFQSHFKIPNKETHNDQNYFHDNQTIDYDINQVAYWNNAPCGTQNDTLNNQNVYQMGSENTLSNNYLAKDHKIVSPCVRADITKQSKSNRSKKPGTNVRKRTASADKSLKQEQQESSANEISITPLTSSQGNSSGKNHTSDDPNDTLIITGMCWDKTNQSWRVCGYLKISGKRCYKYFKASKFGSQELAKMAAIEFQNEHEKEESYKRKFNEKNTQVT